MVELAISRRLRATPFTHRVFAHGLKAVTVYNSTLLPVNIHGYEEDYHHLKKHVQIWDVGAERQVEIVGRDAAWLTQYLTPRDLSNMKTQQCKYAPLVDEFGGIINDPIILKLAEDRFWLSLASGDALLWAKGLCAGRKLACKVFDPDVAPLAVQGPKSDELMKKVFPEKVCDLKFFWFDYFPACGHQYLVAKSGWSHQGGYEIYVENWQAGEKIYDALWEAGQDLNVALGCPNLIERIEAGLKSYGSDMTIEDSPFDAGLEPFCQWHEDTEFLGRTALENILAEGGAKKAFVGMQFDATSCPACVEPWSVHAQGRKIGQLTSAAYSPDFDCLVAMGMVQKSHSAIGTEIETNSPAGRMQGRIVALPMKTPPS